MCNFITGSEKKIQLYESLFTSNYCLLAHLFATRNYLFATRNY